MDLLAAIFFSCTGCLIFFIFFWAASEARDELYLSGSKWYNVVYYMILVSGFITAILFIKHTVGSN